MSSVQRCKPALYVKCAIKRVTHSLATTKSSTVSHLHSQCTHAQTDMMSHAKQEQEYDDILHQLLGNVSVEVLMRNFSYFKELVKNRSTTEPDRPHLPYSYDDSSVDDDAACEAINLKPEAYFTYMFITLILMVIGLTGNSLSAIVFTRRPMAKMSSNVYLLWLAMSDSLYLLTVFLTRGLTTLRCLYYPQHHFDISNSSEIMCKVLQYVLDLFSGLSTCLIIAFTFERLLACYKPFRYKAICTVTRARRLCVMLTALIAFSILPSHMFLIGHNHGTKHCTILMAYERTFTVLYMIEVTSFRIVPVLGIAVINVMIIYGVLSQAYKRPQSTSQPTRGGSASEYTDNDVTAATPSCSLIESTIEVKGRQKNRVRREQKQKQLTIMLLVVSSVYIITSRPALLHFFAMSLHRAGALSVPTDNMDVYQNYAALLFIAGFSLNFFLYTISGSLYRKQLVTMLKAIYSRVRRQQRTNSRDRADVTAAGMRLATVVTLTESPASKRVESPTSLRVGSPDVPMRVESPTRVEPAAGSIHSSDSSSVVAAL